ncbi:MAG TPA: carbohydrate kinase family protein [Limnochordia bacterium]|nr:carbohydrate kinase family protein [Limnochordia bacterium]
MRMAVVGHLCLDIIPHWRLGGFADLKPGSTVEMSGVAFSTGGAVANTGLCLRRLGFEPLLMARVGSDHFAGIIRSILAEHGVSSRFLHTSSGTTSYTIVLSPPGSDRAFLHYPGTNDEFSLEDIDFSAARSSLFHFGYPPLMRQMYSAGGKNLQAMFQRAKGADCITSLDLARPDPNAASGQVDWEKILQRTLPYVDLFLPSLEELLFMISRREYEALQKGSLHRSTKLLDQLGRLLLDLGAALVGIKLGDQGFYLCSGSRAGELFGPEWAHRQLLSPIFKVEARGTTGAGDTTIAGLLAGLAEGCSPCQAATLATAVGACRVESGSAVEIPSLEEVQKRITRGWPRGKISLEAPGWTRGEQGVLRGPEDGAFHR